MKLLALYSLLSPSVLRRVIAPLSVLSERGHSCSFMQVPTFLAGLAHNADCTILPNWVLSDEEFDAYQTVVQQRPCVYDLSHSRLLHQERVQETIQKATLVTVPTEWLKQEIGTLHRNVQVVPSAVDLPFYLEENRVAKVSQRSVLGCFGPFPWHMLLEPLRMLKAHTPTIQILVGPEAQESFGTHLSSFTVETRDPYAYRQALRQCSLGLQPLEGRRDAIDPIWELEYGVYSLPVLKGSYSSEKWVELIQTLLTDTKKRAQLGVKAFSEANAMRASQVAGQYLNVYRKKLPHIASL